MRLPLSIQNRYLLIACYDICITCLWLVVRWEDTMACEYTKACGPMQLQIGMDHAHAL